MPHRPLLPRATAVAALLAGALALTGCSDDGTGGTGGTSASPPATAPATATPDASTDPTDDATDGPTDATSPAPDPSSPADRTQGSVVGDLAADFPTDVVPVLPDSTTTLSSVSAADGLRSVSLSGTTTADPAAVLEFYRQALVAQGFVETTSGQAEGSSPSVFNRGGGAELLVVSVLSAGATQSYTVGGTVAGG